MRIVGGSVRLLASDLDGTLLRSDGTLSRRTVVAIQRAVAAGIRLVLATARPPRWVDPVAAKLACHPLAICSNGALIYDADARQLIAEHSIPPELAAHVLRRLRAEFDGMVIAVEIGMRYGQEPDYVAQWPVPPDALIAKADRLVAEPVAKLIVRHREPGDHWALVDRARRAVGDLVEVTSSGPEAPIEIAALGVSKAFALGLLANQLAVHRDEVLAFGDMPNDVPMLEWAGRSVAPTNAHPDVLAVADQTTLDNDSDGVAVVIEDLLNTKASPDAEGLAYGL
jgi:Cof subfamily protein (haloacid dehalogenase superfamily)